MSDKCELCGSPMEVEVYAGFVAGHREGGLDCARTQLAQSKAREKRLREPEISIRPDPDVPGYAEMWVNGYCVVDQMIWTEAEALAERLRKALAAKSALGEPAFGEVERLRGAIREALRHDLAPGGWGGPAAENILIKALVVKPQAPSAAEGPKALSAAEGEGEG